MSVESGMVQSTEDGWVHVSTRRKGACGGCSHKGHCHMIPGMDRVMVRAKNAAHAQVGDRVEFKLSSRTRFKGLFVMYMFPVIGLLIGAFSADSLSPLIGLNRNVGLFIFTALGLTVAVFIARGIGRRMERKEELTPVVFRILQRAKPPHAQQSARQP